MYTEGDKERLRKDKEMLEERLRKDKEQLIKDKEMLEELLRKEEKN